MAQITMTGWQPGLNKVALTKALQSELGLPLGAAKNATDRLLDGERVELFPEDQQSADRLAESLMSIGAIVARREKHPARSVTG